jgi:Zn-dependent protease with chaperone function
MKFVQRDLGAAAEVSSGGGLRGLLAEFRTLVLLSSAVLLVLILAFALAAEIAVAVISPARENEWMRGLFNSLATVEPKEEPLAGKTARARATLARLAAHPEVAGVTYQLIVVDSPAPNAFAMPGGTIGVTTGLLLAIDDEAALAFVLGHELGHFKHRDHLRAFIRDAGRGTAIAVIFGGANSLVTRADAWLSLGYSRNQEHAADRFGLDLVHATYGRTDGCDALFRLLARDASPPSWAHMLSTHPDHHDRIDRLRQRADELAKATPEATPTTPQATPAP